MIVRSKQLAWVRFKHLSVFPELIHFSTTRLGGVSALPQSSLNMGFVETDTAQNVIENRNRIASAFGISLDDMVLSRQTHSANIHVATINDRGKGVYTKANAIPNNDAFIVSDTGVCACVLTADCVPVFFYDPTTKIAALAHSGWRSTVQQISLKVALRLIEMGCKAENIRVGIGPSIKACCYTVKDDVLQAFLKTYGQAAHRFFETDSSQLRLDLSKAIVYDLMQVGILIHNIEVSEWCTYCNPYLFFSARNSNKGMTGRMMSGVMVVATF
jgi:YfiH family protein